MVARTQRRTAELLSGRPLSPWVRSLVFQLRDGEPLVHRPGQYVDLYVPTPSGIAYKRSYSIAGPPGPEARAGRFEIAVSRVEDGPASTALHALSPGASVAASGPFGLFTRRDPPGAPLLFVATGSGLAPLRAMIADLLVVDPGRSITLLFGCRGEEDILWRDELETWAASHPQFRLAISLSRPPPSWRGLTGHVQRHLAEIAAPIAASGHAYVCGLSSMVTDVVVQLSSLPGWSAARVYFETYD